MKRWIQIGCLVMCLAGMALGQTKVGTTAANFLTIPVGARATAMGGAFVAVANDVSAMFWNPAGLARIENRDFSLTHADWLVGTDLNWMGMAINLQHTTIGFSINQLDYGKEEITTAMQPDGTGQKWEAQDIAFGLSAARRLTDRFSVGATVKYIQQKIAHEKAGAVALDVGLLFTTAFNGMRIGMNISNFGSEMELSGKDLLQPVDIDPGNSGNNENIIANMDTDSWPLPLFFTVGIAMDALRNENFTATLSADATHPNNQKLHLNTGAEIVWNDLFALRGGFNSLFKEAAEEGFTLGFGIRYGIGSVVLRMDYCYMDFGVFEGISRYSIAVNF